MFWRRLLHHGHGGHRRWWRHAAVGRRLHGRIAVLACDRALAKIAERLAALIDQDGPEPDDTERARKRFVTIGRQGADGMSTLTGNLDPHTRAVFEAILAKWARPGMCNPDDEQPCISGTPSQEQIQRDTRTAGQRNHDAFTAIDRSVLTSGELGQHNGLPVTIIVSSTLQELESVAGCAVTGGGSLLPMADVIRMASHAHHYPDRILKPPEDDEVDA